VADERSVHEHTSDEALVNEAERLADGASAARVAARQMEMTRRLNVTLRTFNQSSDRWSRRLFYATWVLLAATLAIVILTLALLLRASPAN
jgi:hypothetical protein